MSEHTKEHPIETPSEHEDSEFIPWREAFPELKDEDLPRAYLRGIRAREGLTQVELSERVGIPQRHISEMENGKRPIEEATAKRLAQALGCNWRNMVTP
jgi:ribosome-binding protein aMBF1 (putative translation factor)